MKYIDFDVKGLRYKLGMTQDDFANMLEVSRRSLISYEKRGQIPESKEIVLRSIEQESANEKPKMSQNLQEKFCNISPEEVIRYIVLNRDELRKDETYQLYIENEALNYIFKNLPDIYKVLEK